ncbi:MAG: DUF599 domain-containing protein [Candidatus Saccharibacteria bacterium]|nr:DUF599 domain-containing protein [Pseudorhodobacter sp.]
MNILAVLESTFTLVDSLAFVLLVAAWVGIGWVVDAPPRWRPSVASLMKEYRVRWLTEFVTRQPRLFDVSLIDSLRQGTAFFASASMIAIGGGVALIGNATTLEGLAQDLTLGLDAAQLRIKLMVVVGLLANALLKFVWSHRLFAYCAIMMAAVPNDPDAPLAAFRARQAAEVNITAAKSFDRGLNSIYFALAALPWLIGPSALIVATVLTSGVLIRREFASHSRRVMLEDLRQSHM